MNREIKFRAWDKKRSFMHYKAEEGCLRTGEIESLSFGEILNSPLWKIMQYTGLHDKQGKEIYEDDYLKTNEADWIGKVVFLRGAFILSDNKGGFSVDPDWEQCEVIGNIYELGDWDIHPISEDAHTESLEFSLETFRNVWEKLGRR